jgi:protein translocase SecG subunit
MENMFFEFLEALYDLSNAMAPYILFGLVFAGILHELVPETLVTKHLGKENISSVVKSTVFGIPLPVCSCGVIPLATSIKKSGASKGATLSFLISTPITGVDSILATYGIFGWIFTLYRVFTSMIIAMIAGVLTNIFTKDNSDLENNAQEQTKKENMMFSKSAGNFMTKATAVVATLFIICSLALTIVSRSELIPTGSVLDAIEEKNQDTPSIPENN